VLVEIIPIRIVLEKELDFPGARPMLNVPFALLRRKDIIMTLGINKTMQCVLSREAVGEAGSMLSGTAGKVRGGADIEGAVRPVRHDVNPSALHPCDVAAG
jgi:hypothetical protein